MKIVLASEFVNPVFPQKCSFTPQKVEEHKVESKPQRERFVIGKTYSLSGVDCDDFKMPTKEYELVGIVNEVNDVVLDSVIMRQISGEQGTIFTLTKNDCRNLNIEFQRGLQLFPKNLNWIEVHCDEEEIEETEQTDEMSQIEMFDPNRIGTYPRCHVDETIRHIMVELNSFDFKRGNIITPNGHWIPNNILGRFKVRLKRTLHGDDIASAYHPIGKSIPFRVMTKEVSNRIDDKDSVDAIGNIYIELFLAKSKLGRGGDGYVGVMPNAFQHYSFNDVFEVSYEAPIDASRSTLNKYITDMTRTTVDDARRSINNMQRRINDMKAYTALDIFPDFSGETCGITRNDSFSDFVLEHIRNKRNG